MHILALADLVERARHDDEPLYAEGILRRLSPPAWGPGGPARPPGCQGNPASHLPLGSWSQAVRPRHRGQHHHSPSALSCSLISRAAGSSLLRLCAGGDRECPPTGSISGLFTATCQPCHGHGNPRPQPETRRTSPSRDQAAPQSSPPAQYVSIAQINIAGLTPEKALRMSQWTDDIICVQETKTNAPPPSGYDVHHCARPGASNRGGGAAIWLKHSHDWTVEPVEIQNRPSIEAVAARVIPPLDAPFVVASVYASPNALSTSVIDTLSDISLMEERVIICTDTNIHASTHQSSTPMTTQPSPSSSGSLRTVSTLSMIHNCRHALAYMREKPRCPRPTSRSRGARSAATGHPRQHLSRTTT
eukprot:PhM_4_TR16085/c1_g1_i4/m.38523